MSAPQSSRPLASIVIPAFNAEAFLSETIQSVLSQTYSPLEIIVVDDGSTDGTPSLVEEYSDAVTYFRQENQGVAAARNRGLSLAKGSYICFVDADDWLHPECIQEKVALLEARPDLLLAFSLVEVTDAQLNPTGEILRGTDQEDAIGPLLQWIPTAIPCPSNVVLRSSAIRGVGGFDEVMSTSADYDLWLRLALRGGVGRIDRVLVSYRRHPDAMFLSITPQLKDKRHLFKKHRAILGHHPGWRRMKWRFFRSVAGEYRRRGQVGRMLSALLAGAIARCTR